VTAKDMMTRLRTRTRIQDDAKIIGELRSAFSWARNRYFNTEHGPDDLDKIGEEMTISAVARDYDLGSNLAEHPLGYKALWLKFAADTFFTPMVNADTSRPEFMRNDAIVSADTTTVASGHPVYFDIVNFDQVRFAPQLPAGCKIRVDYYKLAPFPDPTANDQLTPGVDITDIVHEAIVAKASSLLMITLSDDRAGVYEVLANQFLQDALYTAQRRVQKPVATTPFRVRRRRYV